VNYLLSSINFYIHKKILLYYFGGTLLVAQLVEALRYKAEGWGIDFR
jgi:hypothetical protein